MLRLLVSIAALSILASTALCAEPAKMAQKPILLVAEWCPWCRQLERYLSDRQIEYISYNIDHDPKGAAMYSQLGEPGVPVALVGLKMIQGYRPSEVLEAIKDQARKAQSAH